MHSIFFIIIGFRVNTICWGGSAPNIRILNWSDPKVIFTHSSSRCSLLGDSIRMKIYILMLFFFSFPSLAQVEAQNGFLPTGLGYRVENECYEKWGSDFNQIIKDVVSNGIQCLKDLDIKSGGKGTSGAMRNAFEISKLLEGDKISLVCSEKEYDWEGIRAHASTSAEQVIKEKNIKHPFVSINPKYPKMLDGFRQREMKEIKDTIFHETIHNLGYMHGEDIEYPYTCAECCFGDSGDLALKEIACKVCAGNYNDEKDILYIKDFFTFAKLNSQRDLGAVAIQNYLKENPRNTLGITMLAYARSGFFDPVGGELGRVIIARHPSLSDEEKKYLSHIPQRTAPHSFKKTLPSLANSLYQLYYSKNGVRAVDALEKNKKEIKQELQQMQKKTDDGKYVFDSTRMVLAGLLYEMWVNGYPDGDLDDPQSPQYRAYELSEFFKEFTQGSIF